MSWVLRAEPHMGVLAALKRGGTAQLSLWGPKPSPGEIPAGAERWAPSHGCLGRNLLQNLDVSIDTNVSAICFLSHLTNLCI